MSDFWIRVLTHLFVHVGKDDTYHVEKLIGSGAFAKVFLASKSGDADVDDFETDDESAVVLKVDNVLNLNEIFMFAFNTVRC